MNIKITPEKEYFWEHDKGLNIFDENPIFIPKTYGNYAKEHGIKKIRGKGKDRKITYDCNFCSLTNNELKQLGLKYWGSNRAPILSDFINPIDKIRGRILNDNENLLIYENSIWLYHSTSYENAINIMQNGFKASTGMLGHGIYFEGLLQEYSYSRHFNDGVSIRIKVPFTIIENFNLLSKISGNFGVYIIKNMRIPTQIEDFVTEYGCYFDTINQIKNSYDNWGKAIQLFMLSNGIKIWETNNKQYIVYDEFFVNNSVQMELFEFSKTIPRDQIIEARGCNELYEKEIKKKTQWASFEFKEEYKKNQNITNDCKYFKQKRINSDDLLERIREKHYRQSDFEEGDIIQNILKYDYYDLKELDINLFQDPHDHVLINERNLERLIKELDPNCYEPIISHHIDPSLFGNKEKTIQIIDGNHRLLALKTLGKKKIYTYIGDESTEISSEEDDTFES